MNTLDQLEHFYKYIYVYVILFSLFTYFLLISLGIMIRGTFIKQNDQKL
jgi:hypothetical protein